MEFSESNEKCSACAGFNRMLNEYGLCACCWAGMDAQERAALTGESVDVPRVVTYSLPAHPSALRRAVAAWVGGFTGTAAALGLARLAGWL